MRKSVLVVALVSLAVTAACTTSSRQATDFQYEVMNPWADVDPIPLRGISPRIDTLDGKKIGLFANFKRSAVPQARMVEKKLKGKFSNIQTELYHSTAENVNEMATGNKEKFTAWAKSVDAVVAMVGD